MIDFKNETTDNIWWITKSVDDSIIHYGVLEPEMLLQSGLTQFDTFNNESDWLLELSNLGILLDEN